MRSTSIPDDDQLAAELGALRWTVDSRGRVKIESKDDMRKRGMPSPDHADGLCMAWTRGSGNFVHVESQTTESITGDLLGMRW